MLADRIVKTFSDADLEALLDETHPQYTFLELEDDVGEYDPDSELQIDSLTFQDNLTGQAYEVRFLTHPDWGMIEDPIVGVKSVD